MSWVDSCDLEYALAEFKAENERLQDENERLRSCLSDSAENAKQIMHEAHVQEAENDKLRQLVRELYGELDAATQYDAGGGRGVVYEFADRMRELGVSE